MINLKTLGFKQVFGSLALIPLAVAGTLSFANSSEAAALTGEFQFSGYRATGIISKTGINFDDPGTDPVLATMGWGTQTGTFSAFEALYIKDINFNNFTTNNPLFDLEENTNLNLNSSGDGLNIFELTSVTPFTFTQNGRNVDIGLGIFGNFISATGEITQGAGNFTFQVNNNTAANVQNRINSGGSIAATFSGGAFATKPVPEPATLFGLGLVGVAIVKTRRKHITD